MTLNIKRVVFPFLIFLLFFFYTKSFNLGSNQNVLGEKTTNTPLETYITTPTSEPITTPTPSIKPTSTSTPKPSPTITPLPQPAFTSQEINELINRFAGQYGVSPDVLRHIALCESGFNQFASKAGYAGLFQFGPATWKNIRKTMGEDINIDLRFNAEEAVQTAAYSLKEVKRLLWPNCTP